MKPLSPRSHTCICEEMHEKLILPQTLAQVRKHEHVWFPACHIRTTVLLQCDVPLLLPKSNMLFGLCTGCHVCVLKISIFILYMCVKTHMFCKKKKKTTTITQDFGLKNCNYSFYQTMYKTWSSSLCLVDKNISLFLKARVMSPIKDLMVGRLMDGPLFRLFSRESSRGLIVQSVQSIKLNKVTLPWETNFSSIISTPRCLCPL